MSWTDEQSEHLNDGLRSDLASNCCGASVWSPSGDWAICLDCKEHCEAVNDEPEDGTDDRVYKNEPEGPKPGERGAHQRMDKEA